MKIAIFHNFLDNIGGAEIVTLTLARELNADIYTTNINKDKIILMGFEKLLPKIFSIGKIPINAPFRQQAALTRFRILNLKNKYDFYIIAGDWAMSSAVNNKPNLWYVHSPIREIWDLYEYVRKEKVKTYDRWIFDLWVKFNRYLNKKYIKHVNKLVCNSKNTQLRVKKFLGKDSIVINPPIETKAFFYKKSENYWLSVNRLIDHKRILMQIKAFSKLKNEKLIIVGSYEKAKHFSDYAKKCINSKTSNIKILSWVSKEELIKLYSNCKGFITTSKDEDFGMNVVEAMASGKPVIAPNEGGYKETVINGKTGILIDDINEKKIIKVIKSMKNPEEYKEDCIKQAKKFDTKLFIEKMKKEIDTDYDIKAVWTPSYNCNFSCKYCYNGKLPPPSPINLKENMKQAIEFFKKTKKRFLITFSGGEPFLIPNFISLCKELTKRHKISIVTNLTTPRVYDFIKEINPSKVKVLCCSLHISERDRINQRQDFLKKIKDLKKANFKLFISQVMYPPDFKKIIEAINFFKKQGIIITPVAFKGRYKNKIYPQDYTKKEKELIISLGAGARELSILGGRACFKGHRCNAGKDFIIIDHLGEVYRCESIKKSMGNIFKNNIILYRDPKICNAKICRCYHRGMDYTGKKPKIIKIKK